MSDESNVYIIRIEHEARVLYNKLAAIETIGAMIDAAADLYLTVTSYPKPSFERFLNIETLKQDTPVPRTKLSPIKEKIKKVVAAKKIKHKAKDNTGAVLRVLAGVTKADALTMKQVSKQSGIVAAVGEVLTRLHNTGRAHRTKERPYKYWGMEAPTLQVSCAARRGKIIDRDACVPNNLLDECKTCKHAA